jgi:anti-sigma B factor antagonist
MPIATRKQSHITFLDLNGRLDLGPAVDDFNAGWKDAIAAGAKVVVINLTNVSMVDSSGIGAMLRCDAAITKAGGKLKVVGARPNVRNAFKLTRLENIFEFHDTEASALA